MEDRPVECFILLCLFCGLIVYLTACLVSWQWLPEAAWYRCCPVGFVCALGAIHLHDLATRDRRPKP